MLKRPHMAGPTQLLQIPQWQGRQRTDGGARLIGFRQPRPTWPSSRWLVTADAASAVGAATDSRASDAGYKDEEREEEQGQELKAWSMLRFALPTLVLPLADPLMSLIDTVCIGTFSNALELAAVGPASLLFSASSSLFSALTATALAAMSRALARRRRGAARRAFGDAVAAAVAAGVAVGALFVLAARPLVAALGVSPDVLPVASAYLAIRAFAAPAANLIAVCSAALLAQHDSRSPSLVVLASATFNLGTDLVIIAILRAGLVGAAYGTVVTQYIALAALLWVCALPDRLSPDLGRYAFWRRRRAHVAAGVSAAEIERKWREATPRSVAGGATGLVDEASSLPAGHARPEVSRASSAARAPPEPPAGTPAHSVSGNGSDSEGGSARESLSYWRERFRDGSALAGEEDRGETVWVADGAPSGGVVTGVSAGAACSARSLGCIAAPPGHSSGQQLAFAGAAQSGGLGPAALGGGASRNEGPDFGGDRAVLDAASAGNGASPRCEWEAPPATRSFLSSSQGEVSSSESPPSSDEGEDGDGGRGAAAGGFVLMAVYAAKLICYFTVQGSAMRLSVLELAAHNCMFSLWNVCAFFPVPLQTTALAFLPSCQSLSAVRRLVRLIFQAAAAVAFPLAILCWAVPALSPAFVTADPRVAAALPSLALPAAAAILLCTLDVAGEAILVAQQQMAILLVSMLGVLCAVLLYFFKFGGGGSLPGTWAGLLLFFGIRCTISFSVVMWQQLRWQ